MIGGVGSRAHSVQSAGTSGAALIRSPMLSMEGVTSFINTFLTDSALYPMGLFNHFRTGTIFLVFSCNKRHFRPQNSKTPDLSESRDLVQ